MLSFIANREMPGTNGEEEKGQIYSISHHEKWLRGGVYMSYELQGKNSGHLMCGT
jgi:hypothetical protein